MTDINEADTLEATEEQLSTLREMGMTEAQLADMSFADAEAMIAEIMAEREDAGRIGRD